MKRYAGIIIAVLISSSSAEAEETKIISNRNGNGPIQPEVTTVPYAQDVYNLSFVAYSQQFADQFAADDAYVTEMDDGLHFMEISMRTVGDMTQCTYTVALEKDIKLALPDEEYVHQSMSAPMALFFDPSKTSAKQKIWFAIFLTGRPVIYDDRYVNRTYLGNADYNFNTKGKPFTGGTAFDVMLQYYYPDRVGYQLLSMQRLCGGGKLYNFPAPSIWIRKEGNEERTTLPQKENYHLFEMPESIVSAFQPVLNDFEKRKIELMHNDKD
jgi:hypothetical protein